MCLPFILVFTGKRAKPGEEARLSSPLTPYTVTYYSFSVVWEKHMDRMTIVSQKLCRRSDGRH